MGIVSFKPGDIVYFDNEPFVVVKAIDFDTVEARSIFTRKMQNLPVAKLSNERDPDANKIPLDLIPEKDWEEAKWRLSVIEPLLGSDSTRAEVKKRATQFGVGISTVYEWIKKYKPTRELSSLLPHYKERGNPGQKRLDERIEKIIKEVIGNDFIHKLKLRVSKIMRTIQERCKAEGVKAPHKNTVYSRVGEYPQEEVIKQRQGRKAAEERFRMIRGSFPDGSFPLQVIQIDHALFDVEAVDEEYRRPIGRPWITIAIEVFSRMIFGFFISLYHPSFFSIGQCLYQGLMRKEVYLKEVGVHGEWKLWGRPCIVHADNGRDFRSNDLQRECEEYGISLAWRPVRKPQYGAHIERIIGTANEEAHTLPGSTFGDLIRRGDYNPQKESAMTTKEIENYFANWVVNVYHNSEHSALGMSPVQKWHQGIFGDETTPGTGLPDLIDDGNLYYALLPTEIRTIQTDGVSINDIPYYSPVLKNYVGLKDRSGESIKYVFKQEPRSLRTVFFRDPKTLKYLPVPYRDLTRPDMTLWELGDIKKSLKKKKLPVNEEAIFRGLAAMRATKDKAVRTTAEIRSEEAKRHILRSGKGNGHESSDTTTRSGKKRRSDINIFTGKKLEVDDS